MSPKERPTPAAPDPALAERFAAGLDALIAPDSRVGLAVSGGPDSLALLLLAAAARPGAVEAATVDHRLRPEAGAEAGQVAALCAELGVPHAILEAAWDDPPQSAVQERARNERYRLLALWLAGRNLDALATAHHRDDQAETLLMRLNRGAGVGGLAAMRPVAAVPGSSFPLLRPLLDWSKDELEAVCRAAGVTPADDPSNRDPNYERARVRGALAEAAWLDPDAIARSAANLASGAEAIDWASAVEWDRQVDAGDGTVNYAPCAPAEIRRRIVARAVESLASEGQGNLLRGRELDRLMATLEAGGTSTIRGVLCSGGKGWSFTAAPKRRA